MPTREVISIYMLVFSFVEIRLWRLGIILPLITLRCSQSRSVFYVAQTGKKRNNDLSNLTLIVVRYSGGKFSFSKPCKHCIEKIKEVGIRKVLYSDDDGNFIEEKTRDLKNDHICSLSLHKAQLREN